MLSNTFFRLFEADLNKLKAEIRLYTNEENVWAIKGEIRNSAGNLCLHIAGSLSYLIGTVLGQSAYIRMKEEEFTIKYISRQDLLNRIDEAMEEVSKQLRHLTDEELKKDYPAPFGNQTETVGLVITYLISHVAYHVGQVSYHRRLVDMA